MLLDIGTTQPILYMFASSFAKSSGEKNTSLLWQGNRHYTTHTLASQTKLFAGTVHSKGLRSNLVHSPRTQCRVLCFMWLSQNSKKPPKMPFDSNRNPMVLFFWGGTLSKQDFMRIPVSQSHGSWSPSSGLQLQWTSQPLEVKQLRFLLPKTLG